MFGESVAPPLGMRAVGSLGHAAEPSGHLFAGGNPMRAGRARRTQQCRRMSRQGARQYASDDRREPARPIGLVAAEEFIGPVAREHDLVASGGSFADRMK